MTTTSVKGAGNVMNLGTVVPAAPAAKASDESFQAVWSNRADKGGTFGAKEQMADNPKKTDVTQKTEAPKAEPQKAEAQKTETQTSQAQKENAAQNDMTTDQAYQETVQTEQTGDEKSLEQVMESVPAKELSDEDLGEIMEILATSVAELLQQIADTFHIPVEEVQKLADDMNFQPTELLKPDNLSSLLLEAGGAQDSLALLTDEQLYADFQAAMEQGRQILKESAESLRMTPEQLLQKVDELPKELAEEPVIEVSVETDEEARSLKPQQIGQTQETVQEPTTMPANANKATEEHTSDKKQGRDGETHGHTAGNPFLTAMREEQFKPETQEVQEPVRTWDADTQNIMRQIMDYMRIQVKPDISSLEMQLHPASLGTVQVQIAAKGGMLTANFITQNEAVKAALESQMVQLRESFEQQGVKVEAIEVTVQTHQFEQNLEQGRGRQSQQADGKKGRSRRVELGGLGDVADEEAASQAGASDGVMSATGSTVEYTA